MSYYKKLLDDNEQGRIAKLTKYFAKTRIPQELHQKLFDFHFFLEGSDCTTLDYIYGSLEREARRRHQLADGEIILLYRRRKDNVTFVVTDHGFSWCNTTGDKDWGQKYSYIHWESVHRVEYDEATERFYFYSSPSKKPFDWFTSYVLIKTFEHNKRLLFSKLLTKIARCFYIDREKVYKSKVTDCSLPLAERLQATELWWRYCVDYSEGLDTQFGKIDIYLSEYNNTKDAEYLEDAEDILERISIKDVSNSKTGRTISIEDIKTTKNRIEGYRVKVATLRGQLQEARQGIIRILGAEGDKNKRELTRQLKELEASEQWQNYTSTIDYRRRKFIMPLKEISGCNSEDIEVFQIGHIPACIDFPIGHPVAGTLYIGNPVVANMYKPFEDYEFEFFSSKVNEFCRLMQCLGATEISIRTLKGKKISSATANELHVDGSVGIKTHSVSAEVQINDHQKQDKSSHTEIEIVQRFAPSLKPYIPKDLVWYKEEADWQSKVAQRLNGNMLEFSQRISTKETSFVSAAELSDIKAQAKVLWTKANVNVNIKSDSEFKTSEETEWLVSVKFKSLEEYQEAVSSPLLSATSNNEDIYREEVLFYLEDYGVITHIERHYLEKKRVRLGITPERAKEIEDSCLQ